MSHLAKNQTISLTAEQRRYLSGPIVLHNSGWADTLPEWLSAAIPVARLDQVTAENAGEIEHDLATLEEVCAYLYTASLAFPLDRDHAAIYLWATGQVLTHQDRVASIESVFEMLGEIGRDCQTLTNYQESNVLHVLQRDIRRSVVRHAAGR